MSFETALDAAVRLLEERGQLLNGHLYRLVESDAELFQQIRKQLIDDGIAEDRSGVGLVLKQAKNTATIISGTSGVESSIEVIDEDDPNFEPTTEISREEADETRSTGKRDWWLMSSGAIRGPLNLSELCMMRQYGEFGPADVVRQGEDGAWQLVDQVPILAQTVPQQAAGSLKSRNSGSKHLGSNLTEAESISASDPPSPDAKVQSDTYVPPYKTWIDHKRLERSLVNRIWHSLAAAVGGSRRLIGLICILMLSVTAIWWSQQPPLASTIYREYSECRAVLKRLQDRRVGRAEWELIKDRHRPRIEFIVNRLKSRATDRHPLDQALYRAGMDGLLPMFDDHYGHGPSIQAFEKEMEIARNLLGYSNQK